MEAAKKSKGFAPALLMAVASTALICTMAISGCSQTGSAAVLSESVDSENAVATVTAVSGNSVTVTLANGAASQDGAGSSEKPGGQNANTSSGSATSASASQQSQPPAKPEGSEGEKTGTQGSAQATGDQSGSAPSGEPPSGGGSGQSAGKQATLTINDTGIIYTSTNGSEAQGSLSDITVGSTLELTVSDGTKVTKIVAGSSKSSQSSAHSGTGQGSSSANFGSAATEYSSNTTLQGQSYSSTQGDENAVRATSGATVGLSGLSVNKTGDSSSSEDSDFYGLNAGVLVNNGSNLTLDGGTITTDSKGSNGVFAYGDGTVATVSDLTIRCSEGNSGGIEVAGGATLTASNLDIDTRGDSSAAIRSDRGGGTETVTGGTYTTHGAHSPAVYSTADVTVNDAELTAENCEGIVIEGENSVTLNNDTVNGNLNGAQTQSGVTNNVMIYQSMSGDAGVGTANFMMNGGTFNATHGSLFYVTNTSAMIELSGVSISNSGDSLMTVAGQSRWGKEGSNGGKVTFKTSNQILAGDISVDSISSLALDLTQMSSYTGAINTAGQAGTVSVALENSSTWTLTADSYVSELSGDTSGINLNGHMLYVNGKAWTK